MADNLPFVDMRGKRALVLDDSSTMRQILRMAIQNIGVTSIDLSDTVHDALYKLAKQGRKYDFILCDYILGNDKDGQQFLEELRHRKLLPYNTVFIMVTAERAYVKVVNAVELAPDDYLLKPFSGETLLQRLLSQVQKKSMLAKLAEHMDAERWADAVTEATTILQTATTHIYETQRLKAEALIELHQLDEAQGIYLHLLQARALPWARFGLARIEHLRNRLPEAEAILEALVVDAPRYTAAYDLLSEVKHELENHAGAQAVLSKGVQVSPRNLRRNRRLGAAALLNGDLTTATQALAAVVEHGKHSALLEPGDYINQARCSLALGDPVAAARQAEQGMSRFPGDRTMSATGMFIQSHGAEFTNDPARAQDLIRSGLALLDAMRNDDIEVPAEAALAGVEACLKSDMASEATALANKLLIEQQRRIGDLRAATLTAINQTFKNAGADSAAEEMLRKTREEMAEINNQAVKLVNAGRLRDAMELFKQAAAGKAASPVALQNAVRAMVMVLDQAGWDESLAREVAYMLNRVRDKEPNSAKYAALEQQWKGVQKKYGIVQPVQALSMDDVLAGAMM